MTSKHRCKKNSFSFGRFVCTAIMKAEGNDWQFPFPNYENGDIFYHGDLLRVKAYAFL
jgi:hypothetical protein